ncbi:MAG: TIR domain-containing protein, partial [Thermomicrobiales bacterium]
MIAEASRIFISYQRIDERFARHVREALVRAGAPVWMDRYDISVGAYWPDEIDKGLSGSDVVVGILSPGSVESRNVKNEWDWAIANRRRLILLQVRPCDIPHRYISINFIDATMPDPTPALDALLDAITTTSTESPADDTTAGHVRDPNEETGHLRIQLLGGFGVSIGGRAVSEAAWRQRRAASIVKLLALEPTHRLHREQLMELLWPELDYAAQLNNLRQALHHARRSLESAGMPRGLALERDGDIVVLAPAGLVWVDARAFEQAVVDAWQALTPASAQEALALYSGDLLPNDLYEGWAEQRRTTLRAGYLALLARLAALYDERGEPAEAIDAWQRLVAVDPTNEAAHAALMRLYAGSGQRRHALTQFDQLVAVLERELDASPEPDTCELAEAIREGRFPGAGMATLRPAQASPTSLPIPISQLVGREQELAELRQLLATERLLTLTGPGGIGKTRLAIEVARSVADTFPNGVAFVDLAPVRDPERVIPAIAEALGIREDGSRPLAATLAIALR